MTQQSANDFVQKLQADAEFAAKAKEALSAINPPERHQAIADLGHEFNDEELQQALVANGAKPAEELGEEELESVSGGSSFFPDSVFSSNTLQLEAAGGTSFNFGFGGGGSLGGGSMAHATYW